MSDNEIKDALKTAIEQYPGGIQEGIAAGPKALMGVLKKEDAKFESLGIHKVKKMLKDLKEEFEKLGPTVPPAKATTNGYASSKAATKKGPSVPVAPEKPKGSVDDCPGFHGLTRFLTEHASYCCDTCRCYVPQGAPMWGCRKCDWDVCEGRCHVRQETLSDLEQTCAGIEKRLEALVEEFPDDRTKMALLETEVHKLEKRLDACNAGDLCKSSAVVITEEEARSQKKGLLRRTEALLEKIEGLFKKMTKPDT
eukprot:gnl/MRDRNA2_/MRDRNA2_97481_c0_seq1.p1 gnl/MRDRNA2_/MRDRNA2_97481_c0~~gnl/MRDRNA2_/MRDRNA2_97481_c0_seq1.p1  ORF type:complete len:253 (+),score=58.19 gnl/MRDRNA2_/MRDRNA2_97481_c0_seq1:101-859(+)